MLADTPIPSTAPSPSTSQSPNFSHSGPTPTVPSVAQRQDRPVSSFITLSKASLGLLGGAVLVGLLIMGAAGYYLGRMGSNSGEYLPSDPGMVACTEDAMICPDGSAVGRVPPTCEFAACPTTGKVDPVTPDQTGVPAETIFNPDATLPADYGIPPEQ